MSARIYLLAAGAFAVGTSAYVVSGVLPAVSSELHVSLTAAGQLATAFALSYAVGAPLMSTLTGRWERRTLLIAALLLAALGNGIAAIATNYPILIVGRIVAALGAAAYTPAATLFATTFLPPEERGRAGAVVFGGLTFALVLGVPAGSLLGDSLGYRGVFALIAVICLVVVLAVRSALPTVEASAAVSLRERFAGLSDRRVQTVLVMSVLAVLATMSVYIYVVPLLAETAHLKGGTVGVLLLVYGVGAVLGNLVGGRATDRFGSLRATTRVFQLSRRRLPPATGVTSSGTELSGVCSVIAALLCSGPKGLASALSDVGNGRSVSFWACDVRDFRLADWLARVEPAAWYAETGFLKAAWMLRDRLVISNSGTPTGR